MHRSRGCLAALVAGVAVGALPAAAASQDLSVGAISVSQAVQTESNSIPLVARRSTVVRARVQLTGPGGVLLSEVAGVTGRLHVFQDGVRLTPADGLAPLAPVTARVLSSFDNEADTLNFELPAPTAIGPSSDVDVQVDITPHPGEPDPANNTGVLADLAFVSRVTPHLRFVRVDYTPAGNGPPLMSRILPGVGDAFVRGIFPVDDADPSLYQRNPGPMVTFSTDPNGDGFLGYNATESDVLMTDLGVVRDLTVTNGFGALNRTFLYGFIRDNPIQGNGVGALGGRVGFGNTDPSRYQRTFAHELVHNFGQNHHTLAGLDGVGWDVDDRLGANPAGNSTAGRMKPSTLVDIMVAGRLTNEAWINSRFYDLLLNSPVLTTTPPGRTRSLQRSESGVLARRVLVVSGALSPNGRRLARIDPSFRYPWLSEPVVDSGDARYRIEARTSAGRILSTAVDGRIVTDSGHGAPTERETFGAFSATIPVPPDEEVARLRILDPSGRVLRTVTRSPVAPKVRVTSPAPRSRLGGTTRVRWTTTDPDTPGRELMTHAAFSPDGGRNFVAVAVRRTDRTFTMRSAALPKTSPGRGLLRLFTSDGLNTTVTDVTGLTVPGARGLD